MTDQNLSAIANSVIHSFGRNYEVIDVITNGATVFPGAIITRDQETTTSLDVSIPSVSATDPDSMDVPWGVAVENVNGALDDTFSDDTQIRGVPLHSDYLVWLRYAANDQATAIAVYPGDIIVASETEAGKVMKAKELSATLINTPTTALLRDAAVDLKIAQKNYIGRCVKYNAGHATDDKWILVRLS